MLDRRKIRHNVLNAKNHAKEAEIIEKAGQRGAVTIATNMAGRGTDIKLGEGVAEIGGLAVIGSERMNLAVLIISCEDVLVVKEILVIRFSMYHLKMI